jgi:multidrug efflux pump subunit AcrB
VKRALVIAAALASCRGKARDDVPAVTRVEVTTNAPGMAASDVEVAIANVFEDAFAQLPNLIELRSTSSDGRAIVTLDFADTEADAVIDRVQRAVPLRQLPGNANVPTVSFAAGPIALRYVVRSADLRPAELATAHDRAIVPTIEATKGVGRIETCGEQRERLEIVLDPEKLLAAGVTIVDILAALRAARGVAFDDALRSIIVAERNGARVRISDVARLEVKAASAECDAYYHGLPVLEGIVRAQPRTDVETVRAAASRALHDAAPPGVAVEELALPYELAIELPPGLAPDARRVLALRARELLARGADALVELRGDRARVLAATNASDAAAAIAQAVPGLRAVADGGGTWIRVLGADLDVVARVERAVASVPGVAIVERDVGRVERSQTFELDRRAVARLGTLDERAIAETFRAAMDGVAATTIAGRAVVVRVPLGSPTALTALRVSTRDGVQVPLAAIAHLTEESRPSAILHVNRSRAASLRVRVADDARETLRAALAKVTLPTGNAILFDGAPIAPASP